MQFNTFVATLEDVDRCATAPNLTEVLIEPALLARQGTLGEAAAQRVAIAARQQGLRPVLVWDSLMPESQMRAVGDRLARWDFSPWAAVRVCDPGAAYWVMQQQPTLPLQLIAETGHHNLPALQGWCELLAGSLERLILSIELPERKLVEYCQTLPVGCEVLGVGPILLFYSPRSLLAAHSRAHSEGDRHDDDEAFPLQARVAFADAPQRPFPTVETAHGTLMFLDKDQFILDRLEALRDAGLHTLRLDLRHLGQEGHAAPEIDQLCHQIVTDPVALRHTWPRETRAPFFNANRTTALFPRMKSKRIDPWREYSLAAAIAGERGQYLVFQGKRSFSLAIAQRLLLPTGETVALPPGTTFRTLEGTPVDTVTADQLLVTDWIKKVVPGSLLLSGEAPDSPSSPP